MKKLKNKIWITAITFLMVFAPILWVWHYLFMIERTWQERSALTEMALSGVTLLAGIIIAILITGLINDVTNDGKNKNYQEKVD